MIFGEMATAPIHRPVRSPAITTARYIRLISLAATG